MSNATKLDSIVKKFLELSPIKKGTKYTYTWGAKKLTLDIKSKKIRGAIFEEDSTYFFMDHMEKLGFGENILHTLKDLSSTKSSSYWDTILTFEVK